MNPLEYQPRDCHFIEAKKVAGIDLKLYLICSSQFGLADIPAQDVLEQLYAQAFNGWQAQNDHNVGFAILHLADDGLYFLASVWNDANMIRHKVLGLSYDADGNTVIAPLGEPSIIACVWELKLMSFERDAWIECVLNKKPKQLNEQLTQDYLNCRYQGSL